MVLKVDKRSYVSERADSPALDAKAQPFFYISSREGNAEHRLTTMNLGDATG